MAFTGPDPCVEVDDDYLTPTWPAISGTDGTLLAEVAPLTGNVWIWAAPDDAPPSASTAILALGRNVQVSAYWSDSDPPIDKTTNPLGQYSVNVPTKTGALVADLVSPDFSVFSAALDSGTPNADCDGDGVADCSLYRITQTWDTHVSLEYDLTLAGNNMDAKKALFLLALQYNTTCWDSIRSDLTEVDSSFFSGQYSALINAALDRHNIP